MKSRERRARLTTFALCGLCAALSMILYQNISKQNEISERPESTREEIENSVQPHAPAAPILPRLEQFSEIVKRPLFSNTRRPEPRQEIKPLKENLPPERKISFTVIGIVLTADTHMALIEKKYSRDQVLATEGDSIEGWVLESISPEQVTFRSGNTERVIVIQEPASRFKQRRRSTRKRRR